MLGSIFKTATFKQSQITTIGTFVNGILGAFFYILLARFLGPSDFGLLSVSIVTLTLISDISDLGTNTGLIRFVSSSLTENKDKGLKFLKLSLEIKAFVWLIILALGIYLSPFIADKIFNKVELTQSLRLVMIGVGGALFFSFTTSSLQAFQKYFTWSLVNIITNLLRLVFIILLLLLSTLTLTNSLIVYIIFPFFGFSLALFFLPFKNILLAKNEFSVSGEFFKYNIWVALFTLIAAISSRLDTFLNVRLLSNQEVGIYAAANQLVQVVPQLIGALGIVAAPKFAGFQNKNQMLVYFKKFQLMVLGISVLGLLGIPMAFYSIPILYGINYISTIIPFVILLLAMLIFLISIPLHNSIIFYFGKPQIFVWVSIGHLLIISFVGYHMILRFGVIGAAITVFLGMLFNFVAPLIWFLFKIRK